MKTILTILALVFLGLNLYADEPTLKATPFSQIKIGNGKAMMLEFGSTSCHSCVEMGKILYNIKSKYPNSNVYFIDIYKDMKAAKSFKIRMIPTQVFLDKDGNYITNHVGMIESNNLIENLKKLQIL